MEVRHAVVVRVQHPVVIGVVGRAVVVDVPGVDELVVIEPAQRAGGAAARAVVDDERGEVLLEGQDDFLRVERVEVGVEAQLGRVIVRDDDGAGDARVLAEVGLLVLVRGVDAQREAVDAAIRAATARVAAGALREHGARGGHGQRGHPNSSPVHDVPPGGRCFNAARFRCNGLRLKA
ncbi:hypothetical protein ACLEPN_12445 [Myxococcus sp. 1LA]